MSLFKDMMPGSGILIGLGAIVAAPVILPVAAAVARPAAKLIIKGSLAAGNFVVDAAARTQAEVKDMMAEIKTEQQVLDEINQRVKERKDTQPVSDVRDSQSTTV